MDFDTADYKKKLGLLRGILHGVETQLDDAEGLIEEVSGIGYDYGNLINKIKIAEVENAYKPFSNGINLGDIVFVIQRTPKEVPCPTCDGQGKVKMEVQNSPETTRLITCPDCHSGRKTAVTGVPVEMRVAEIQVTFKNSGANGIRYILSKTGGRVLGNSGTYYFKDIYKTEEECQVIIDNMEE